MPRSYPKMRLSEGQFDAFMLHMLPAAWATFCADNPGHRNDSVGREQFRHDLIFKSTGHYSIKTIPRTGGAYANLMAEAEIIARNGIKWQLRREGAATRPIAHIIRDLCQRHDLDEHYACGIARNALNLRDDQPTPDFEKMKPETALTVLRALKIHIARHHSADAGNAEVSHSRRQ